MSFAVKDLVRDFRSAGEMTKGTVNIGLLLEGREPLELLVHELLEDSQNQNMDIVDLLKDDTNIAGRIIDNSDLIILAFSGKSVLPKRIYDIARSIQYKRKPYKVVIETANIEDLQEIVKDISKATDKKVDDLSVINTALRVNFDELAKGCVELLPEPKRITLGRNMPFFRTAAANSIIAKTARQNGVVSTVMFTGAEFPVLTANQIKMILEIAGVFGEEIDEKRLKEILAVVGTGYTLRTAARSLLGLVPGPQFFIKGAISYFGTWAMGRAAIKYFEDQRLAKVRSAYLI